MTRPAGRLAPFAVVLTAGLLAACGGAEQQEAADGTPEPSSASASTEPSQPSQPSHPSGTTEPSADGPARERLTTQQIVEALPKENEAPEDFVEDPRLNAARESTRETDPDRCGTLFLDGDEARAWKKEHLVETEGVRYTAPGDGAGRASVSTFVTTYDEPVPKELFDDAAQMMTDCPTFRERNDADSPWIDKKAGTITAPALGDQTHSQRVSLLDLDLRIDHLWIRSGHNIISVATLGSSSDYSGDTFSDVAEGVLEDLER